jgi:hypothetical protein
LPPGWESDREQEVAAGDPLPALVPGTLVTLRNVGEEPLVLLRLRVLPIPTGAPEEALVVPRLTALPVDLESGYTGAAAAPDTRRAWRGEPLRPADLAAIASRLGAVAPVSEAAAFGRRRPRRPRRSGAGVANGLG